MDDNPYQVRPNYTNDAFTNSLSESNALFRKGSFLVVNLVHQKSSFPDRCILSNEPTSFRLKTVLYWHLPVFYLLILAGPLVYVLVAMFSRKRAEFYIPLAERYVLQRRQNVVMTVTLLLAGILIFVFGIVTIGSRNSQWFLMSASLVVLGPVFMFFAGLLGIYGCRIVFPKYIDNNIAMLGGASPEFLASLPEWPSAYGA